jgi:hypothetical protein
MIAYMAQDYTSETVQPPNGPEIVLPQTLQGAVDQAG